MNEFDIAEALRDCLCGHLTDTIGGPVCRCSLYPSGDIPFDICTQNENGNGQAAVALVRTYLSREFPVPVTANDLRCDYYLAAEYRLSVVRCAPAVSATGMLPTPESLDAAAQLVIADANALRCAAVCCLEQSRMVQVIEWSAYQVSGGCMGGELSIIVQTDVTGCFTGSS